MSKTRLIYAKTGVTFGAYFFKPKSTNEVTEELYKELQETRFFRHGILTDVTKTESKTKKK